MRRQQSDNVTPKAVGIKEATGVALWRFEKRRHLLNPTVRVDQWSLVFPPKAKGPFGSAAKHAATGGARPLSPRCQALIPADIFVRAEHEGGWPRWHAANSMLMARMPTRPYAAKGQSCGGRHRVHKVSRISLRNYAGPLKSQ